MPVPQAPRPSLLAPLVLALGLLASVGAATYVHATAQARARQDFEARAQLVARVVARPVEEPIDARVGPELLGTMELRVHDLGPAGRPPARPAADNLLYVHTLAWPGSPPLLRQSMRRPVGERVWQLDFSAPAGDAPGDAPVLVFLGGALASVLLCRLLGLQSRLSEQLAQRVAQRTAELAQANAALRASEQRLELALAGAELGLWDWNVATGTLAWNARWLALRGCAAPDLPPGMASWKHLVHPEDREAVQAALDAHLRGETPAYAAEYRVGTGARPWRWILDSGRVVERDVQGRPLRMAGTNLDISARKLAEGDRAAREAAERASRAKSEFLARTSHELRTPLNAILGFAQMMRLDAGAPLPALQQQRLQHIQDAGDHLLTMINEMLDLNGIEAGHVRVALGPVALAPLAASCLQAMEPLARAAGVQVRAELPPGAPPAVQADATRLREVLLNLLSNAIKYNQRGGWVRLSVRGAGAARVALAVEDGGAGLSEQQLAQLFQPFNRLGAERTGVEGTGLGLVISRRLAQLMRGSLHAARREGGGSVFTLELPVAQPRLAGAEAAQEPDVPPVAGAAGRSCAAPDRDPAGPWDEAGAMAATAGPVGPAAPVAAGAGAAGAVAGTPAQAQELLPAVAAASGVPPQFPAPAAPARDAGNRSAEIAARVVARAAQSAARPGAADRPAPSVVLYIEDEPVNALLMQHVLALRPQCRLRLAEDGTSGLVLARQELPDLVLIDLNLPDMSGHEVLARLRADPAARALRCVALTADAMPHNAERARAAGFDEFWSKPIEVQRFLLALDEQLALARQAALGAG